MKTRTLYVAVFVIVLSVLSAFDVLAQSCGCDVPDAKEQEYDQLLDLTDAERTESLARHLPYGIPTTPTGSLNEHLLVQRHFVIMYDDDLRIPLWVAYRLTAEDIVSRTRLDCFRRDLRLSDEAAAFCPDYVEPVFDRGHMAARADMNRSEAAMINTFTFANMTPQHARFNQGIWRNLEARVRDWAEEKGDILVISGVVLDRDADGRRDADDEAERMRSNNGDTRVAVPTTFYKIVLHERPSGFIENLTILLPHNNERITTNRQEAYVINHITSIDEIEVLTGIDFLTGIAQSNPNKERAIERFTASRLW